MRRVTIIAGTRTLEIGCDDDWIDFQGPSEPATEEDLQPDEAPTGHPRGRPNATDNPRPYEPGTIKPPPVPRLVQEQLRAEAEARPDVWFVFFSSTSIAHCREQLSTIHIQSANRQLVVNVDATDDFFGDERQVRLGALRPLAKWAEENSAYLVVRLP